jgi:hypothetical protein
MWPDHGSPARSARRISSMESGSGVMITATAAQISEPSSVVVMCRLARRSARRVSRSVRVGSAAASAAAAPAGRRPEPAVVGGLATGGGAGRQRHQALEVVARTLGAGHLLLPSDQELEPGAAAAAAIIVNGHERRFAGAPLGVKRPWAGVLRTPVVVARPPHRRTRATSQGLAFPVKYFAVAVSPREKAAGKELVSAPTSGVAPKVLRTATSQGRTRATPGWRQRRSRSGASRTATDG